MKTAILSFLIFQVAVPYIRSGDNHFGYIGYRAKETGLSEDEVIDGMVDDLYGILDIQ